MVIETMVREFLQRPLIARMTTIDPDGYPHTVPVWFMLDGNDIVIASARATRKVAHIRANPKGSVAVGGDPGDGAGYLLKGDYRLEDDAGAAWLRKITYYYEDADQAEKDLAEWGDVDMIVIRLVPKVVIKVH